MPLGSSCRPTSGPWCFNSNTQENGLWFYKLPWSFLLDTSSFRLARPRARRHSIPLQGVSPCSPHWAFLSPEPLSWTLPGTKGLRSRSALGTRLPWTCGLEFDSSCGIRTGGPMASPTLGSAYPLVLLFSSLSLPLLPQALLMTITGLNCLMPAFRGEPSLVP